MGYEFMKWSKDLIRALTPTAQNGKSTWGMVVASTLPYWIQGPGGNDGVQPWAPRTSWHDNPYTTAPPTGETRRYEFNVSRERIAPDGYEKEVLLVNGQFPGPLIEANWGDWIEVTVNNGITSDPPEGTALHWHGFLQTGTPWEDGTPGVSQCPIAPGDSYTYRFRAELYGSSWYHSHYSAQYSGGLFGPIVVYGPQNVDYDIDVGPIMINDWWHEDYYTTVKEVMAPGFPGVTESDNNLINGRMNYDCTQINGPNNNNGDTDGDGNGPDDGFFDPKHPGTTDAGADNKKTNASADDKKNQRRESYSDATTTGAQGYGEEKEEEEHGYPQHHAKRAGEDAKKKADSNDRHNKQQHKCTTNAGLSKFRFQSGKTHRLRLINSGSEGVQRISLDEHTLTVIALDFVEVEPYETQVVTLGVGQRADVLVRAFDLKDNHRLTQDPSPPSKPGGDGPTKHDGNGGMFEVRKSAYWLRANMSSCAAARQPLALAAVYYEEADPDLAPRSRAWDVPDPRSCADEPLDKLHPAFVMPTPEPSYVGHMDIGAFRNESDNLLWTFGGTTGRVDYNDPTLLQAIRGDFDYRPEANVVDFGTNSSIRLIVNNNSPGPHPMHAHGMNMYVLSAGPGFVGKDNYTITNPENPMRRDVQNVAPGGHIVVQMDVTNAGMWPFHCHIAWHASAGFFSQMLFRPREIAERWTVPEESKRLCRRWDAFTKGEVVNQIDSGL